MINEDLETNPNKIENNSSEVESTKNLCVHELTRKLKDKQRKENIIKVITFFSLIIFIGIISLLFY